MTDECEGRVVEKCMWWWVGVDRDPACTVAPTPVKSKPRAPTSVHNNTPAVAAANP